MDDADRAEAVVHHVSWRDLDRWMPSKCPRPSVILTWRGTLYEVVTTDRDGARMAPRGTV